MLKPEEVSESAAEKEEENLHFRSYLKSHANEEKLDQQFLQLHQELFDVYDCSKCRNCCRKLNVTIPKNDLQKDADVLGITVEELKQKYLQEPDGDGECSAMHKPCDFLSEDGSCMLKDCRPDSCRNYPYTDQPERISSLYSVLDTASICPVAFEIWERLKQMYCFHYRPDRKKYRF